MSNHTDDSDLSDQEENRYHRKEVQENYRLLNISTHICNDLQEYIDKVALPLCEYLHSDYMYNFLSQI